MRFKPLKRLGLILSLSKDEDTFSGFFSILLDRESCWYALSAGSPVSARCMWGRTFRGAY
jgi:hypothetical protein